ncbi:thioredoxin domain-containing protein [uncultured Jannaschia sp.]|uniref:thioredoxin domain-containing protein n=1 Tax=uncultured Jannaschia sp. TaxID=293347 RepID=UPI00261459A4|nr:thioredoxin domain-containing protein [uncultured Jannaschia sp.]
MINRRTILGGAAIAGASLAGLAGLAALGLAGGGAADASAPGAGPGPAIPDMVMRSAAAPIEMIEYASFTCSYCARFHEETFDDFVAEFVETGRARLTYREVFFDRPSLWAALVARSAPEARYLGLVSLLYETQKDWARAPTPADISAEIRKVGLLAGLDGATIDAGLADAARAEELVA